MTNENFANYSNEELLILAKDIPTDLERADLKELAYQLARRLSIYVGAEMRRKTGWT